MIQKLLGNLKKLGLKPIIGLEWEFYLLEQNKSLTKEKLSIFFQNFLNSAKNHDIDILNIEKEQGEGQVEIKTKPYSDILKLCQDFLLIKKIVRKISYEMNLETDFYAQKYLNDCGSSLQINLNFLNNKNINLFSGSSDNEGESLLYVIAGILGYTAKFLENYIFSKEDLVRFNQDLNIKLHKSGKYTAPINLSWGYDNRTAAIRIIGRNDNRRLEFRIPSSNSYIFKVIESLFESALAGITKKALPQKAIYGNAFNSNNFNIPFIIKK